MIQGNEVLLPIILFNLVYNLTKYTPRNRGTILIDLSEQDKFLRIEIINPGEGIPDELQERIFCK